MYRLVCDVACNRLIYFTNDRQARLVTNQHVYIREWFDPMPMGITHENCWDWKLIGDKLVLDITPTQHFPKTLLELNKERILKFLYEKINDHRRAYDPSCHHNDWVRQIKLAEANQGGGPLLEAMASDLGFTVEELCNEIKFKDSEYRNVLINTEIFRERYKEKITIATTNEELYRFRDEIADYRPGKSNPAHSLSITIDQTVVNSTLLVK